MIKYYKNLITDKLQKKNNAEILNDSLEIAIDKKKKNIVNEIDNNTSIVSISKKSTKHPKTAVNIFDEIECKNNDKTV